MSLITFKMEKKTLINLLNEWKTNYKKYIVSLNASLNTI